LVQVFIVGAGRWFRLYSK